MHNRSLTTRCIQHAQSVGCRVVWGRESGAVCLILLAFLVFFSPFLLTEKTLYPGAYGRSAASPIRNPLFLDNGASDWIEVPLNAAARQAIGEGELPLWNPYNSLGMPILANTNGATLAPLGAFLNFFTSESAWGLMYVGRLLFATLCCFFFFRKLGVDKFPAVAGALLFGFSGYSQLYLNHFHFHVDAMMPFLFWASLNYARQQNRLAWLLLILAVVGIILGGNPQNLILTCLGASAFFSTVLVTEKQHRHYQPWLYYFLAYVLATGICSVYGLSFYELYSLAAKYHTNWGVSAFPAQALLGLVFPIFVFIPTLGVKFLPYLGMLTFATLIGGTRLSGKFRAVTIFFLATTLLLLLKIVGFPGINWLGYLPTLNEILFTKYTAVLYFSLSILFGLSIQELLAHDRRRRFFVGLALTVILMVVFYFQLDRAYRHASHLRYAVGGLLVFGVGVWALLCTVTHVRGANPRKCLVAAIVTGLLAELFLLCRVYPLHEEGLDYGAISQAPEFVTFLRQDRQHAYDRLFGVGTLLMGNLASTYGLHDIRGLSATSVARYYQFMHQLVLGEEPGRRPSAPTTSTQYHPRARPILNLLGVNYIIFDDCKTHDLPHTRLIYEKSCVKIYRNLDAYPRAFVRHDYKVFSQRAEVLAAMKDGTENLTTTALLVQKPDVEAVTASAPPSKTPPAPAHITRYDANAVHLTVTLQHPGILTLSDLIFPGWNVYVDHKPHALLTVDYLLRGVALPIGQHDVRFVYQPDWLRYGSLTSGVFLLLTALIARVHGRNARKKNCLASHPDRNLGEI